MTSQMQDLRVRDKVERIISDLSHIGVDGETMQYILEQVGMHDQMLRQLVMSQPIDEVRYMFEEREELEDSKVTYCGACGDDASNCDGC
jgi:hypothetical protein